MARKRVGVRRHGAGWQAYVDLKGLPQVVKTFPLLTPYAVMKAWRDGIKSKYPTMPGAAVGSFGADIEEYLARRAAMPTLKQTGYVLDLWADLLGRDRTRASITGAEIEMVMQQWLKTPTNQPDPTDPLRPGRGIRGRPSGADGIAVDTVRKRYGILRTMFYRLDGPGAHNAVCEATPPPPPKPAQRGVDKEAVQRILAAMPDCHRGRARRPNVNKIRARVVAYTGFPPKTLQQIGPRDLNLAEGFVRVGKRYKAAGTEARTVRLQPAAVAAFRDLLAAGALHPRWDPGALNAAIKRAILRPGVNVAPDFSLYDLRHSFGSELLRWCGDEATVARALLHAPGSKHTHRYTLAAHGDTDAAAAARMGAAIDAMPAVPAAVHYGSRVVNAAVQPRSQNLAAKPGSRRKVLPLNRLAVQR